jgi:hypothetical protein
MRTSRESFLLTGKAPDWKRLVASDAFEPACLHALMQLASEISDPLNPTGLAQIIGARRVLEILGTISEPETMPKPTPRETLHY